MTVSELARVVHGHVEGGTEVRVLGAEVDSRRLREGDLFVALRGARCDGHTFVDSALETAAAALVRSDAELDPPPAGRALVRTADPLVAYHELAAHERQQRGWTIAAVTGSVGKTTTKDFLAAFSASQRRTGASTGNRNSTLGLPAELLSQSGEIEVFVAETGMSQPGELSLLGGIIRPQVVLYTRIAPAHTEFFPDLDGIVRAKAELIPWLDPDGTLVINADDPHQKDFPKKTPARTLRYGTLDADASIDGLKDKGLLGSRFRLVLPDGEAVIDLALAGLHQAENLLAAATAAHALGVSVEQVAEAAPALEAPEHRGRVLDIGEGITVVDDSYNASPLAVRRLLELLARAPGRKVAVIGEMYELGELAAEAHRQAGLEAAAAADLLVAVGGADAGAMAAAALDAGMAKDQVVIAESADEAATLLRGHLRSGDVVLVKGSRGVGLDRTVAALVGEEAA